ncbi:MAG: porin [Sphingobium sp.]|nr:porin [Sphingobium sp.]MBP8672055.1 porin [Sphingobium sp.]MBP9158938.1 porin [Sphingobium sp.]MCC6482243.1 porin [Sphingomonadaceae bacterium]
MKHLLLASAAILALLPSVAVAQTTDSSPIDSVLPADDTANVATPAAPASTGNAVLDRLNAMEARIRQLESRNTELEQQASETQNRVQNVEVRAAKAAQPGVVPTYADVTDSFTFKPRGVLQIDYATFNERQGGYQFSDGTDLRRARFGFEGTAYKRFKWRLDAEYVKQAVNLLDAYISYTINPKWSVTLGQHKAPYGLEANTSDANNTFFERSLASNTFGAVGAERRLGLSLAYNTDKLNAAVGVFGGAEGITRNATTRDEPYGVNARITFDPILDTGRVVHVGASAYHVSHFGNKALTLSDRPNVRVDGGTLFSVPLTNVQSGDYLGAEGALVFGPFSVQGEYGTLKLDRLGALTSLEFAGFNIFGSVFLTGESRSFKGGNVDKLKPFSDFDPANGKWGAVELAARYDEIDLTDPALGAAISASNPNGRKAHSWTGALNWYLNPNFRASFNYIRFTGRNSGLVSTGIGTSKGDVFASRLQIDF